MIYGSDTWPLKKSQENKLAVAEMKMLRWSLSITRRDGMPNRKIREMVGLVEVSKKAQEPWLHWYRQEMRRDEECIGRKMELRVEGRRQRAATPELGNAEEEEEEDVNLAAKLLNICIL